MDKEAIETVKIVAEATGKIADLGVKALETTEKSGNFISKLTGVTDSGFLGIIEDKVSFYRYEIQCKLAEKYNKKYGNQPMQPIPPKFLIPILENASMEDDDSLQDLWINLLGSWTNEDYKEERRLAFVDIIKALTPTDALILKMFYNQSMVDNRNEVITILPVIEKKKILSRLVEKNDYNINIDNLMRLQCLKYSLSWGGLEGEHISITHLGIKFVEACMGDN